MIVVSGWLRVEPGQRARYLVDCHEVVRAARSSAGCVDFAVSADPLDNDRINIFEQWDSATDAERFRGSGPSTEQQEVIVDASVWQHEVIDSVSLTG